MTAPYRKKLIEVGLPLAAINAESAREKSIRHGHPSTLHLWWARRPLAACRAVLFASLVDDPDSDPQYHKANGSVDEDRAGLKRADLFNLIEELVMWENSNNPDVIRTARAEIARCVASRLIETGALKKDETIRRDVTAYDLVRRAHCRPIPLGLDKKVGRVRFSFDVSELPAAEVVNDFLAKHAPPVLDPFAGGGSIPLEAQRLGLRAYASDLNPIPVLINKALIEIPPKFAGRPPVNPESRAEGTTNKSKGKKTKTLVEKEWLGATGLAEDVRYYGRWMRDEAEKRIGSLYPKITITNELAKGRSDLEELVGQERTIIAWLWARTVASPNPVCKGAHVPLVSSLMLSTKEGKKAWAEIIRDSSSPDGWRFQVRCGQLSNELEAKAKLGTKAGKAKDFVCSLTSTPIPRSYIQDEGKAGRLGCRLMAVVCEGHRGRLFLSPDPQSESSGSAAAATPIVEQSRQTFLSGETPTRAMITGGVCSAYGLRSWAHLFTPRQLVALTTFGDLVQEARSNVIQDAVSAGLCNEDDKDAAITQYGSSATSYANAVATYLAFGVNRTSNTLCTIARWAPDRGQTVTAFARQGLPMTFDYPEVNPFASAAGDIFISIDTISKCIERLPAASEGHAAQLDVMSAIIDLQGPVISTDPPYYDNIGYAILSDFFYVWLRRSLNSVYPSLFSTVLTPKTQELIVAPYRHDGDRIKAQHFFEAGLGSAFRRMWESQTNEFPLTVYYAFKQAESDEDEESDDSRNATPSVASTGWETMLSGLINAGYGIHGTWPMRSELANRPVASGANALASSIVLVCRPRPIDAPLATRKQFISELRNELPEALRNLQRGNIAPVDLAQAAIGPGMAVFTRYSKVIESEGSLMSVRTALGIINQVLDEVLAEQEGEFDAETRWSLAWFEQFGMGEGPFGDAELLSKAKVTAINGLVEAGIITARAGKVRFLRRDELPADWNPASDNRLTVWEVTQHLIRTLDQQGESGAALLVSQIGGLADISRDLAYRLYSTCERKKWTDEALAYNGLVIAWSELSKLALSTRNRQAAAQQDLFT